MKTRTVCFTGGHLSPALAAANACRQFYPDTSILFIGREYSFENRMGRSVEREAMTPVADTVYTIQTGRLTLTGLFLTFRAVIRSLSILRKERPVVILSFGGYVAVPVVLAGRLLSIPVVTHEQTRVVGRANRLIAMLSKKVCVSFPEMIQLGKGSKYVYTGLPLRSEIVSLQKKGEIAVPPHLPCLYITGGTTGAVSLNDLFYQLLPTLLDRFVVIHQTGNLSYPTAEKIAVNLPGHLKKRYIPKAYFSGNEISWILHHVLFVIGRSGANTVWELAALGVPAILIPLPWSPLHEQQRNAEWIARGGSVLIADQDRLDIQAFLGLILEMHKHHSLYKKKAVEFSQCIPRDGVNRLLEVVFSILK